MSAPGKPDTRGKLHNQFRKGPPTRRQREARVLLDAELALKTIVHTTRDTLQTMRVPREIYAGYVDLAKGLFNAYPHVAFDNHAIDDVVHWLVDAWVNGRCYGWAEPVGSAHRNEGVVSDETLTAIDRAAFTTVDRASLTPADRANIAKRLRDDGCTPTEIATEMNLSVGYVRTLLRRP